MAALHFFSSLWTRCSQCGRPSSGSPSRRPTRRASRAAATCGSSAAAGMSCARGWRPTLAAACTTRTPLVNANHSHLPRQHSHRSPSHGPRLVCGGGSARDPPGRRCERPSDRIATRAHSCGAGSAGQRGHTGASGRQAQCSLAPTAAVAPSNNTRWVLSSKAASALSWLILRALAPLAASLTLSCTLLSFCRAHQVAGLQAGRQRLLLAQALGAASRVAGALRQPVRGAEHAGRGRGRARHAAVAARRKRGHRAREPAPRAARALETR